MMKVTALSNTRVEFISLLGIYDGVAHMEKRSSSEEEEGYLCLHDLIYDEIKVGDYVYFITSIEPGTMIMRIEPVKEEEFTCEKKIFEDYENDCLKGSYSSEIRDYKLNTIINEK